MRRAVLFLLVIVCAACGGDRFRVIDGPAQFSLTTTTPAGFSATVTGTLQQGGRAYFGPQAPAWPPGEKKPPPPPEEPAP